MDDRIQKLERAAAREPENIELQVDLARAYARYGWAKPTKAARDFMAYLKQPSWTVQGAVDWIESSLDTSQGAVVELLGTSLSLGDEAVRKRAAWVLPQINAEAIAPTLIGIFRESFDAELRRTLASILNRLPSLSPPTSRALARAVADDPEGRGLLTPLLNVPGGATAQGLVDAREASNCRNPAVRGAMAQALSLTGGLDAFIPFLKDSSEYVRFAAAQRWLLGGGSPRELFLSEKLPGDVRLEGLVCATDAGERDETLRRWIEFLLVEIAADDPGYRRVCQALAAFGDDRAFELLLARPRDDALGFCKVLQALSLFPERRQRIRSFLGELDATSHGWSFPSTRDWLNERLGLGLDAIASPRDARFFQTENPKIFHRGFDQRLTDPGMVLENTWYSRRRNFL